MIDTSVVTGSPTLIIVPFINGLKLLRFVHGTVFDGDILHHTAPFIFTLFFWNIAKDIP